MAARWPTLVSSRWRTAERSSQDLQVATRRHRRRQPSPRLTVRLKRDTTPSGERVRLMKTGLVLSVSGASLLLAGPLGSRVGLWSFVIGFLLLALSLLLGLVGASLSLVAGFKTGQGQLAVAGSVICLAVVSVPSAFIMSGVGKPPIHDITTDTVNPPPFVAILPLRARAANPPEYGGGAVAAPHTRASP